MKLVRSNYIDKTTEIKLQTTRCLLGGRVVIHAVADLLVVGLLALLDHGLLDLLDHGLDVVDRLLVDDVIIVAFGRLHLLHLRRLEHELGFGRGVAARLGGELEPARGRGDL